MNILFSLIFGLLTLFAPHPHGEAKPRNFIVFFQYSNGRTSGAGTCINTTTNGFVNRTWFCGERARSIARESGLDSASIFVNITGMYEVTDAEKAEFLR